MHVYEVYVGSSNYKGRECLAYSSSKAIPIGTIVEVPLRDSVCLGVIASSSSRKLPVIPKEVKKIYSDNKLEPQQLQLVEWMREYYPGPLASIAQLYLPKLMREISNAVRKDHETSSIQPLPPLTEEQHQSIKKITDLSPPLALLHGETGTGKTRVYLELAQDSIERKKSVIILTPEIGLTPQLVTIFERQFPGQVIVINSRLSKVQRDNSWATINRSNSPLIIIGPRSALFAPVKNLGLIVVDEAHDKAYKQDQTPHYEATRVAAKLARLYKCSCVLGTATPRLADYWHFLHNKVPIIRLKSPIHASISPPSIDVIDIKQRENFIRSSIFSDTFLDKIQRSINKNNQSLVFLNRRGTARIVICQNCGWTATCKNCDIGLSYHGDKHTLLCHLCGIKEIPPTSCPSCASGDIIYKSLGTKSLETELAKHFPNAKIQRFDSDNNTSEQLDKHYDAIIGGDVDILVGTQILAKGLDIPRLDFVGLPFADSSIGLPDYTADEQGYQLLRQVAGRVGRTKNKSSIVLQTYNPQNPLLSFILQNKWQDFYDSQIKERKAYNYPPFYYMLQLTCVRKQQKSAKLASTKLIAHIKKAHPSVTVIGPSPRFYEKVRGEYHWQVIVKAKNRQKLLAVIETLPPGWRYNIDPSDLL